MTKIKRELSDGSLMIVEFGMHKIGEQLPYFSITADIVRNGRWESGGCLHDEIRRSFPELAELIPFHLHDSNGLPMHYVANAVYWMELSRGISKWNENTEVPYGYASFEDVLSSHILADTLGDREEMREVIKGEKSAFVEWMQNRIPALFNAMQTTLAKHGIAI